MPTAIHLRMAEDWRGARIARRFMLTTVLTPNSASAATNLIGLRKLAANPVVFISRIRVHLFHSAAAVSAPLGWKRATTVAGGNPITAADLPKCDTAAANATLEVRPAAPTAVTAAAEGAQYMITHPGVAVAAPAANTGSGWVDDWTARDLSERIRLDADEGLILELQAAGDVDTRIHLLLVWEEVT